MEEDRQALIHQRYDKAYKTLLRNPEVFCRFMRSVRNWRKKLKILKWSIRVILQEKGANVNLI